MSKKRKQPQEALFEPVNGHTKSIERIIKVLKQRKSEAEAKMLPYQEEVRRCEETIQSLRGLLGYGSASVVVVDAMEAMEDLAQAHTPSREIKRRPGRYSSSLYNTDTGIHAEDAIRGYVKDLHVDTIFTGPQIRDMLITSGKYPQISSPQVLLILNKLGDEGRIYKKKGENKTQNYWAKRKPRKGTTKKASSSSSSSKKNRAHAPLGEKSVELLKVIKNLPNRKSGFTTEDVMKQVQDKKVTWNSVVTIMGVLNNRHYIKQSDYDDENFRNVYVLQQ